MSTPEALAIAMTGLVRAMDDFPQVNWTDATSPGQMRSKVWLVDVLAGLNRPLGDVLVVGGWVGMLGKMLLSDQRLSINSVRQIDLDMEATRAANRMNRYRVMQDWLFRAFTRDAMSIDYGRTELTDINREGETITISFKPGLVINTSWEHFPDPKAWFALLPAGTLVAIQASSNTTYDGHVSPVATLDALRRDAPLREELYGATREISGSLRHTLVGLVQ